MKAIKYWLEDYWPQTTFTFLVFASFVWVVYFCYQQDTNPRNVRGDTISGTYDELIHCREGVHLVQVSSSDAGVIYRCVP